MLDRKSKEEGEGEREEADPCLASRLKTRGQNASVVRGKTQGRAEVRAEAARTKVSGNAW